MKFQFAIALVAFVASVPVLTGPVPEPASITIPISATSSNSTATPTIATYAFYKKYDIYKYYWGYARYETYHLTTSSSAVATPSLTISSSAIFTPSLTASSSTSATAIHRRINKQNADHGKRVAAGVKPDAVPADSRNVNVKYGVYAGYREGDYGVN